MLEQLNQAILEKASFKQLSRLFKKKNYDHGIWSHHFMADRKGKSRSSDRFYFLRPQITVDGECIHEMKRYLLLGRKTMTNLDSVLNNRDITLLIKVHIVKTMVFQQSCMDVRFGLQRKLSVEELVLSNYGAWRGLLKSLGLQGDQTSQS